MNILRAFKLADGETHEINIRGNPEKPLFQASQIANLLGLQNIRVVLQGYTDLHKVVLEIPIYNRLQKVTFLTEQGLYLLLANCRKPWPCVPK